MFVFTECCGFGPGSYSHWLGCQNILRHICFLYLALFSDLQGRDCVGSTYFPESLWENSSAGFDTPPKFYYVNYDSDTLPPTLNLV